MTPPDTNRPIAFLAATMRWGGIECAVVNLANAFVRRGLAVDLLLTRGGVAPYPERLDERVNVIDLKNRHKITALPRLVHYLRRRQPRALLPSKYHGCMVALWARRWVHPPVPTYPQIQNTLSLSLPRARRRRNVRRCYPAADRLIAVSQGVADDLVNRFGIAPGKVRTIVNPVLGADTEQRCRQPIDQPWLSETNRAEPVILAVGRLAPQKDFPTLLRAFARVRQQRACRLVILGEGGERAALTQLARDLDVAEAVAMPGAVADPLPCMARADLFVLSSVHEGLANVVPEALGAGTPVVSTDCPSGPRQALQEGRLGPLTPPGDDQALAKAMIATLDDPLDAATLRAGAAPFFADCVADQYLEVMAMKHASD